MILSMFTTSPVKSGLIWGTASAHAFSVEIPLVYVKVQPYLHLILPTAGVMQLPSAYDLVHATFIDYNIF